MAYAPLSQYTWPMRPKPRESLVTEMMAHIVWLRSDPHAILEEKAREKLEFSQEESD